MSAMKGRKLSCKFKMVQEGVVRLVQGIYGHG